MNRIVFLLASSALVLIWACSSPTEDVGSALGASSARERCVSPSTSSCDPSHYDLVCSGDATGAVPSFCRADGGTHLGLQTWEFCCGIGP